MILRQMPTAAREQSGRPTSIGGAWPPLFEPHNRRVKGIYTRSVIGSNEELTYVLQRARGAMAETGATRGTVRVFVSPRVDVGTEGIANLMRREAAIPTHHVFPESTLVYFGYNLPGRSSAKRTLQQETRFVAQTHGSTSRKKADKRLSDKGLEIESLRNPSQADIARIQKIYQEAFPTYIFGFTAESLRRLLGDGNLVIVGRSPAPEREIVSILVAEPLRLNLEGTQVTFYELSPYATDSEWRGKGLMTAIQMEAIRQLRGKESAIIYAEARAPWTPATIASIRAGMICAGTLEQHCVLNGVRDIRATGNYEDLNVMFAP